MASACLMDRGENCARQSTKQSRVPGVSQVLGGCKKEKQGIQFARHDGTRRSNPSDPALSSSILVIVSRLKGTGYEKKLR